MASADAAPSAEGDELRRALHARIGGLLDSLLEPEPPPAGLDPEVACEIEQGSRRGEPPPGADLSSLWRAVVGLTQEVKLQGRAFKRLQEELGALGEVPAVLDRVLAAQQEHRTLQAEAGTALAALQARERERASAEQQAAEARLAQEKRLADEKQAAEMRLVAARQQGRREALAGLLDLHERMLRAGASGRALAAHAAELAAEPRVAAADDLPPQAPASAGEPASAGQPASAGEPASAGQPVSAGEPARGWRRWIPPVLQSGPPRGGGDSPAARAITDGPLRDAERSQIQAAAHIQNAARIQETGQALGEQAASLGHGLQLCLDGLEESLRELGVEWFGTAGERFEPHTMQAIEAVAAGNEDEDGTVARVHRPGYRQDGQLIRPAEVTVARHTRDSQEAEDE